MRNLLGAPVLRFVAACIGLLLLVYLAGYELVETLLPTYRWALAQIDDHFRILYLGLASQGADSVIRLDVSLQRPLIVGPHLVMPDPRGHAHVTTLSGHALQPLVIFAAVLLAWPASGWYESVLRGCCGFLFGGLMVVVDVPFVLVGELWALLADHYATGNSSPLLLWKDFLQNGGRPALAFVLGAAAVLSARRALSGLCLYDYANPRGT